MRPVALLEVGDEGGNVRVSLRASRRRSVEADFQRGVGAVVLEMQRSLDGDARGGDALRGDFAAGHAAEVVEHRFDVGQCRFRQRRLDRTLAQVTHVGQAHPVGGEHAGERMDEHTGHAQGVGDGASVLPAGPAEATKRVLRHVVAALDRDVLDRVRHVVDGDLQEALGDRFRSQSMSGPRRDVGRQRRETLPHDGIVEGQLALRAEHARKRRGVDLAHHQVAVGDRQRAAAAIARRSGIGAGRLRADAKARTVERADRTAAGSDRVYAHHRRAQAHAGDFGDEGAFVLACVMRDVGRRASHVEADDPVEPRLPRDLHRADDASRGTGQDRILALEAMRVGQPAARLHELQTRHRRTRGVRRPEQVALDLSDIAAQDRRQIGIDHRRVAARDQLHQRAHFVARRDLRIADRPRQRGEAFFVLRIAVGMHQHDRAGSHAVGVGGAQRLFRGRQIELAHEFAVRADTLIDLDHALVEHRRQHDPADEQLGSVLIGDAQRIAEAAGDRQNRALAAPLEQCVGRDRRAHFHGLDGLDRNRRVGRDHQQFADACDRRVAVPLGVFRQQLVCCQRAVRSPRDDVGKRSAAVDPELPACLRRVGHGNGSSSRSRRS